ncbi:unnamed protein product [Phytophthora fragariaefolia]|uniref:Mitochondrial fission process protein 1 n=1 Tax=Phytophthora fragariaefolia TaxID=1490495 RepID=A0A9W6TUL2_9STRA|nr:unnamed protein product [Phytophthora fragariaefolia]
MTSKHHEPDIWRESLVRYLGYANELGESFRPIAARLVAPSYVVAFGYVLGDTYDKASKAHSKAAAQGVSDRKRNALVADATIDTLAWQTMASVVIPGFTINRVVRGGGARLNGDVMSIFTSLVGRGDAGRDELARGATRGQELAGGAALGSHGHWAGRHPVDHPPDRQLRGRCHGQHGAQVVESFRRRQWQVKRERVRERERERERENKTIRGRSPC